MLIVSDFKDYYDNLSVYGIDKKIVYNRKAKEEEWTKEGRSKAFDAMLLATFRPRVAIGRYLTIIPMIVSFCEKIYPFFEVLDSYKSSYSRKSYIYEIDKLIELIKREDGLYEEMDKTTSLRWIRHSFRELSGIEEFLNQKGKKDVLTSGEIPVILYENKIVYNPCLREYDFQKCLDPYTARQELERYFASKGVSEDIQSDISDVDMRDMKGFDDKSFKMSSPGKKRKRRKS